MRTGNNVLARVYGSGLEMSSSSPRVTRRAGRWARAGFLLGLNASCWAHARLSRSSLMLKGYTAMLNPGPEVNAGLDAGPIQNMCGASSVPGPNFGENLTFLFGITKTQ